MTVDLKKKGLAKPVTITRGGLLYVVLALFISTITVSAFSVIYTNHSKQEADKRWCTLFAAFDRPVPPEIKDPVQRARSEQTVAYMHQLRINHGCIKS